ncbi:MAG: DUF1700 domain-containing protein [Clostridia bacterium]|nr:DUF1700 domain-containing protein [Clostridia bacterium]
MDKQQFLSELRNSLSGIPRDELEERLLFYSEMIDDRIEEGMSEEEAVAGIGQVGDVVNQILSEVPLSDLVKERFRPGRSLKAWEIVLIILGAPLWLPLLIAAAAVILSLYIALWAVVISLWAVEVSIWVCVPAAITLGIVCAVRGHAAAALGMFGIALFCVGFSVFFFVICVAASRGLVRLAKAAVLGLKARFARKEESK